MKKTLLILAAILVLGGGFFYWYRTSSASVGSLNVYNGSVEVIREDKTLSGATGTGIKLNDTIKVGADSRVSIILKDGSVVRLEAGTEVVVAQLEYDGKKIKSATFDLKIGRLWSHTEPLPSGSEYEVETPTIVAAVRGTSFNIDYLDQTSLAYVYRHSIKVIARTDSEQIANVDEDQVLVIDDNSVVEDIQAGPDDATPPPVIQTLLPDGTEPDAPEPVVSKFVIDDWIIFNEQEDDKLDNQQGDDKVIGDESSNEERPTDDANPDDSSAESSSSPASNQSPLSTNPSTTTPSGKQLTNLKVSINKTIVEVGATAKLSAQGTYSDGSTENVTSQVIWTQTPQLGTIDKIGNFYAETVGTTGVTGEFQGAKTGALKITVTKKASNQTTPTPPDKQLSSVKLSFVKLQSQPGSNYPYPPSQFTAMAMYSDGSTSNVTDQADWTVTPGGAEGTITSGGYYQPRMAGSDKVVASYQNVTGSLSISTP